jgi:crotonobetainyl-CoA:carnitine CoA-transferase CaiB-like acyl-CoA transferase
VEAGVPAGGILRASDIAEDPHYRERDSLIEFEDPVNGKIAMPGVIPKLSETPGEVKWTGPALGHHNQEIYEGLLDKTKSELLDLQNEGII